MSIELRCRNFNHGRINVTIRFCPDCGEKMRPEIHTPCDDEKHASRRKQRNLYCCDCGRKLRED